MATPPCSRCKHGHKTHSLHPCSCPNDRLSPHPMHICATAYHHVWCYICMKFCTRCALAPEEKDDVSKDGSCNGPKLRFKSKL
ncbi:hypothetical protein BDN70DRAFT_885649 [Pholiota conissans]|uniref:Uncharacterized protein n=1 Tax=Pholiota conissans TaxID=109636 RepID=A0A9P6CUY7_9AGAR|nr:hypothetical protein BDN70DRAFT_885649 [Pholiota conissans]